MDELRDGWRDVSGGWVYMHGSRGGIKDGWINGGAMEGEKWIH